MTARASSADADGIFERLRAAAAPWREFSRATRFEMGFQAPGQFDGGRQSSAAVEIVPPGKQAGRAHHHALEGEHDRARRRQVL